MEEAQIRTAVEDTLLRECGERGYRQVELAAVLARSGVSRAEFRRVYDSLDQCYATAYAARTGSLAAKLEAIGRRAGGWRPGLRAVLRELASFIEDDPPLAAGIVVEVGVAGGEALAGRGRLIARGVAALRAVDGDGEATEAPSRGAAELLVYMVEAAASTALAHGRPEQFRATLPELVYMIVAACFDERTARAEGQLVTAR